MSSIVGFGPLSVKAAGKTAPNHGTGEFGLSHTARPGSSLRHRGYEVNATVIVTVGTRRPCRRTVPPPPVMVTVGFDLYPRPH
jgi:hypothetical protein